MVDLISIFIPLVAFWFTNITGIPQKIRTAYEKKSLKPFDCPKCFAFWLGLAYQIPYWNNYSFVIAVLSSVAGWLLENLATKFNFPINR